MRDDLIEALGAIADGMRDAGEHEDAAILDRVAAALEAARKDAERYRWLDDNAESLPYPDMWRDKEWLDAAIDQARGKGGAGG